MNNMKKNDIAYGYYSKVLKEPFDSIEELKDAEEAYFAKQKAKEDKAAAKKADALKVEEAFKGLNAARKLYKSELLAITNLYRENLTKLKDSFEKDKAAVQLRLAEAEEIYNTALKTFSEKYPEGFHITLKDGDFETTISGQSTSSNRAEANQLNILDLFNLFFKQI
jgi:hypothetical protein